MNLKNRIQQLLAVAGIGLLLSFGGAAHAQDTDPAGYEPQNPFVVTDTGSGQAAPAQDGTVTPDATDSAAFPTFYVSAPGTGNVAGYGYADEDIMKYQSGTATWSKAFDGTDKGLPASADIDAVALIINSGYISFLMSFDAPVAVPGLGTVDDSDVVRFDTWNNAWSMYLVGSSVGLTTDGEDIDSLTFSSGGFLVVSTRGGHAVKNFEGGTLKGNNKDLILLVDKAAGTWTRWLRGSQIGMQSTNDITNASFVRYNESIVKDGRYITGKAGWTLPNGTAIGAHDVSEQLWFQNGYTTYYKKLDASDAGFPKIDALEVVK